MYVNNLEFSYKEIPSDLYFYFKERLEGQRFDSIAGAIQKYTENILIKWTRNALKATRARKVCFGGGVAMNIKAIMELAKLPEVEDIFICPTPSDESLAIGAAYVVMHDICLSQGLDPAAYLKPLKNTYLGPAVSQSEIKTTIEMTSGKGYSIHENPKLGHIAQLIADGKIIGLCVGRSEFGARALGNRSILADPRRLEVVKVINEKIKSRDFWMPFSPSILEEESDRYLINHKKINSPYMTIAFETKPLARKHLIASLHQADFTARPQIVNKLDNPHFYNLLKEFHSLTGIGGVLNTSFNVHGEPIIQSPEDAFDVFERTKLDVLLLDGYLIERIKTSK
jgi:carbamoyltransferase